MKYGWGQEKKKRPLIKIGNSADDYQENGKKLTAPQITCICGRDPEIL